MTTRAPKLGTPKSLCVALFLRNSIAQRPPLTGIDQEPHPPRPHLRVSALLAVHPHFCLLARTNPLEVRCQRHHHPAPRPQDSRLRRRRLRARRWQVDGFRRRGQAGHAQRLWRLLEQRERRHVELQVRDQGHGCRHQRHLDRCLIERPAWHGCWGCKRAACAVCD